MLYTNLKHIESRDSFKSEIDNNENVMICCGRMGPMCLPVYDIMENLEKCEDHKHISFRDMAFDSNDAGVIRDLPETKGFMSLPFTIYFKNGNLIHATSGIQSMEQVSSILDEKFKK